MANGWIISGGEGAGKATLAYRIARRLLTPSNPRTLPSLHVDAVSTAASLVASGAHPDLFVAEPSRDENGAIDSTFISVGSIRALNHFLALTASMGGWRIAIIDTADQMNLGAQNALLKALEEPRPRTCILLLSSAPGRLPATIRSRCRKIRLLSMPDVEIAEFLRNEGMSTGEDSTSIVSAAKGRPGFALRLAAGTGMKVVAAAADFLDAVSAGRDVTQVATIFNGKAGGADFTIFVDLILDHVTEMARHAAYAANPDMALAVAEKRTAVDQLLRRGEALNLDRTAMLVSVSQALGQRACAG
jgi:DNA polymerase-3 subunit delta'